MSETSSQISLGICELVLLKAENAGMLLSLN